MKAGIALVLVLMLPLAQPSSLSFEAASVKPHAAAGVTEQRGFSFSPAGHFSWTAVTLRNLIGSAYAGVPHSEVVGGPSWIDRDRFDVIATSQDALRLEADGTPLRLFQMLRTLLEDRFRLKAHTETRERPIFALSLARRDESLGPKLHRTTVDCAAVLKGVVRGREVVGDGAPPCSMHNVGGHLTGHSITMPQLAGALASAVGRVVVDRTGLSGVFDVELEYAPELRSAGNATGGTGDPAPLEGASVFTALIEQLGLRLESTRSPIEVLVIDHAEPPTPN